MCKLTNSNEHYNIEIYFGADAGLFQEYNMVNPILTLSGFTRLTIFNLTGTKWYKRKNGMWYLLLVQFVYCARDFKTNMNKGDCR